MDNTTNNKSFYSLLAAASILGLVAVSACGPATATASVATSASPIATSSTQLSSTTQQSSPTTSLATSISPTASSTTAPPTSTAFLTFGDMASLGGVVYSGYCMGCHGGAGQGQNGPALWGAGVTPGVGWGVTFFSGNAQNMLTFIHDFMPLADPGRLSHDQYAQVTCYILVQAGLVSQGDSYAESDLKNIAMK